MPFLQCDGMLGVCVEPWTFEQKLGEVVFIAAGCAHQVRNLKSCIKVAMDFVSPENVDECIKLTEEFRRLPSAHRAKEDKLEIKKIALHALNEVVNSLDVSSDGLKMKPKNKDEAGAEAEDEKAKRRPGRSRCEVKSEDRSHDEAVDKKPKGQGDRRKGEVKSKEVKSNNAAAADEEPPRLWSGRQTGFCNRR